MLSPDTWHFLELYKDIIANGLDLLSFIFVTPELLRVARPAIQSTVIFFFLGLFMLIYFLLVFVSIVWIPSEIVALACFMGGLFAIVRLIKKYSDRLFAIAVWAAHHAFLFGVFLFFVSRVIGFATSAHQLVRG